MRIVFNTSVFGNKRRRTFRTQEITVFFRAVDKLAAEEQSYIESHNIDKDVDFNYADMKYNEFYENSMDLNTRCSAAVLYADAVKNGIVDGTEADAVTMIDYAHNMPTGENSEAELAEYNKQFDPKIIEAYNKQLDEYTKFKAEYETLTDEQKAERMNADPRYAVMGTSCEYDKATSSRSFKYFTPGMP